MQAQPPSDREPGALESSVVVCTYDAARWAALDACLMSVERQLPPPLEVIVVVDHNRELLARAREAFPKARVIANERARGLAGSRNSGAAAARGEIVAFIDDDATAEPGWLGELTACLGDPGVVGAGGALIPRWPAAEPRWFPPEFLWVVGCSYAGMPEDREPIRNPIGASMAVRADALAAVGGFREGAGPEAPREIRSRGVVRAAGDTPDDTDMAIRVGRHLPHAVWLYSARARALHSVTPERATLRYFLRRCHEEGRGKAALARRIGARDGLRSERRHLALALPSGFARGLRGPLRGDPHGPLRSGAMLLGLAAAALGFLAATLSQLRRPSPR